MSSHQNFSYYNTAAPRSRALSLPGLLSFHQGLLALTIFIAAQRSPLSTFDARFPIWSPALVTAINALVFLLVTRRRAGVGFVGPVKSASPLLWIPALYFLLLSLFYAVRHEIAPAAFGYGLISYGLTLWLGAHVFALARDARFAFMILTFCGLAVCAEATGLLLTRGAPREMLKHGPFWSGYGQNAPPIFGYAFMDSNALASLLIVFGSIPLGLLGIAQTPRARIFPALAFLIFAVAVFFTGSRGGAPFFLILTLAWAGRKQKRGQTGAAVGSAAILGVILVILTRLTGGILRGDSNLKARFHMWRASLRAAKAHPMFGDGPNAFAQAWRSYGPSHGYGNMVSQPDGLLWSLLAEGGLVLAGMGIAVIVGLTLEVLTTLKQAKRPENRELLTALALGIAAALGHELLETTFKTPVMALLTCLLVGLTLGTKARQSRAIETIGKSDA